MKTDLNVVWKEEEYLSRWLKNQERRTRETYLSAFRAYSEFTGMTMSPRPLNAGNNP